MDDSDREMEDISISGQNEPESSKRCTINVGGTIFVTLKSSLRIYPHTLLGSIAESDPSYDPSKKEYFFDRNPFIFNFILDLYRKGEVHFPHDICGPTIKSELHFWEIDDRYISPCCVSRYLEYEEKEKEEERIEIALRGHELEDTREAVRRGCWNSLRHRIFLFLEYPRSSPAATIWAISFMACVCCSVFILVCETNSTFRVPRPSEIVIFVTQNFTNEYTNPKLQREATTILRKDLRYLDFALLIVFTLEVLLRFWTAPSKRRFVFNIMNFFDILSVVPVWVLNIVLFTRKELLFGPDGQLTTMIIVLKFLKVTRVVRIIKLSRLYTGLRVICLSLKDSFREMLLLTLVIFIGMVLFSSVMYYTEYLYSDSHFTDIPVGFWWSVVTMTTVGYGDKYPQTLGGYVVGAIAAIMGIILAGLPIPIITSNFDRYYTYVKKRDKRQKRKVKVNERVIRIKKPCLMPRYSNDTFSR